MTMIEEIQQNERNIEALRKRLNELKEAENATRSTRSYQLQTAITNLEVKLSEAIGEQNKLCEQSKNALRRWFES